MNKTLHVIVILIAFLPLIFVTGCTQPNWQYTTLHLLEGQADAFAFDLAKDQIIDAVFYMTPKGTEIVVIVFGVVDIEPKGAKYTEDLLYLGRRYKEYAHIKDGSRIKFKAPTTYTYAIWAKPRLAESVGDIKVYVNYWFST